ncbi:hypothetical protein ACMD2_26204, partial [Ananas comosus]
MKVHDAWQLSIKDMAMLQPPRHRPGSKRPMWIIVLVSLVCVSLIGAYVYPPRRFSACYFFASNVCSPFKDWLPLTTVPSRELTDDEIASRVVIKDILAMPSVPSKNQKIAFIPGDCSEEVEWGKISMIDAERRLLANALQDPDNQHFVLLSD